MATGFQRDVFGSKMLSLGNVLTEIQDKIKEKGKNMVEVHSTDPLDHLTRTDIEQLTDSPAKGFYLLLRCIKPVTQLSKTAIQTYVEDHLGNVISFVAFSFVDPELGLSHEDILPVGTVFVLKEPSLEKISCADKLRCECPSDVLVITRNHKLYETIKNVTWQTSLLEDASFEEPTTGEDWKARGSKLFVKKRYNSALESYLMALKYANSPETTSTIRLNLIATYFALGFFETCLMYSKMVLETDPVNTNALFRAGKSCYILRNYEEAKTYFQKLVSVGKVKTTAVEEANWCIKKIQEAPCSKLIGKLAKESSKRPKTHLDYPDFVGPVDISPIEGKGNGIIAKSDIKPGTRIVVSKALCAIFINSTNSSADCEDYGDNSILKARVTQMILKNPNTIGKLVYDLTSGDTNLDQNGKRFCDEVTKEEPITDVKRIGKILPTNCFRIHDNIASRLSGNGFFIYPSYFNHACIPNAAFKNYNDIFVIHAVQFIPRGEEITLNYSTTDGDFSSRSLKCQLRNFKCDCVLCILDGRLAAKTISKVSSLVSKSERLGPFLQESPIAKTELKLIIKELEEIYKRESRNQLQVALFRMYNHLALSYFDPSETLKEFDKSLRCIGLNVRDLLEKSKKEDPDIFPPGSGTFGYVAIANMAAEIMMAYGMSGRKSEARKWLEVVVHVERVCCGGNMEIAKAEYKQVDYFLS